MSSRWMIAQIINAARLALLAMPLQYIHAKIYIAPFWLLWHKIIPYLFESRYKYKALASL